MKILNLFFALLLISQAAFGRTFYVDASAAAGGNGSPATPWNSITQVNAASFQATDTILFKRGGTYYGGIVVKSDTLSFGAYGTGANPIISGFDTVAKSSWTLVSGHIWKTTLSNVPANFRLNMFKYGTTIGELGRYPNPNSTDGGFLKYEHFRGDDTIYDTEMPISSSFAGADICVKKNEYTLERNSIKSIHGDTVIFTQGHNINPFTGLMFQGKANYGYFIENSADPLVLDRNLEWAYDTATKDLTVYFTYNPLASGNTGYVSTVNRLLDIGAHSNITISNLDFLGGNEFGIYAAKGAAKSKGIHISGCAFKIIGGRGIGLYGVDSSDVQSCTFYMCFSTGIQMYWPTSTFRGSGCRISDCNFNSIAPWPGMGSFIDNGDYNAIYAVCDGLTIEGNNINTASKGAITWQGNNVTIQRNLIQNVMQDFSDYGAIYSYADTGISQNFTNRIIEYNTVFNCPGSVLGANATINAKGIYLDGRTMNVNVNHNTVYNVNATAISANNPVGITLSNNMLYNNPKGINFSRLPESRWQVADLDFTIDNNIIYSTSSSSLDINYQNENNVTDMATDMATIGSFSNNYYGHVNPVPFTVSVRNTSGPIASSPMKLSVWQALTGLDASSHEIDPIILYHIDSLIPGNLFIAGQNGQFNTNTSISDIITNPNGTVFPNSTYINKGWQSDNNGGGSMLCTIENPVALKYPSFYGLMSTGTSSAKKYILRYTTVGSLNNGVARGITNAYLRKLGNTIVPLVTPQTQTFGTAPMLHEYLFSNPKDTIQAQVGIELEGNSDTTYIDNIELFEADVTDIPVDTVVKFYSNPYSGTYLIPLPSGTFKDVYGNSYYGSFTLYPTSSRLLFRQPGSFRPTAVENPIAATSVNMLCFPNPADKTLTITNLKPEDDWQTLSITGIDGRLAAAAKNITGQSKITIDVASLAAGEYLAVLKNKAGKTTAIKFVKL